jgi:uncharacterized membrane protein
MNQPSQPGPEPTATPALDRSLLLPCVKCGYDLRGSDPEGTCPECGAPNANSLIADPLWLADSGWAFKIAEGCRWLNCMCLTLIVLLPVWVIFVLFLLVSRHPTNAMAWTLICLATQAALLVKTSSLFMQDEPGRASHRSADTDVKWLRRAGAITGISMVVSFCLAGLTLILGLTQLKPESFTFLSVLSCVWLLQFASNTVTTYLCVVVLADVVSRVNDPHANKQADTITKQLEALIVIGAISILPILSIVGGDFHHFVLYGGLLILIPISVLILASSLIQLYQLSTRTQMIIKHMFAEHDTTG